MDLGILYSGEHKSILFRLSLRKMEAHLSKHSLMRVKVEYLDINTGLIDSIQSELFIERGAFACNNPIPETIDTNLNRYQAAKTIIESIELASNLNFADAQKKLEDCIKCIRRSPSGRSNYCRLLIEDLNDCISGMRDVSSFQSGVHYAHAYANMYYMERSSGVELIRHEFNTIENDDHLYGYLTNSQIKGQKQVLSFMDKESHNY